MTTGANREPGKTPPAHPHGIIPSKDADETRSSSLIDFRLCGSFLLVVVLTVVIAVVLRGPYATDSWPFLLPVVVVVVNVSRRSMVRVVRVYRV
ncbi:hypothetical protein ACFCWY_31285 [Streptomyces sp. NPDC056362]|uniref:hypothetical protein n=1 Tax=unclassified Streptomyces TaxID=2593676 RepID=UPI0035E289EE